jgi:GT2 family glycosyltransferase
LADTLPQQEPQGPQVSAIFVVHNQAAALRRALEALQKIKHPELLEIVVVDCASSDGTQHMDTDFAHISMLRMPHHFGAVKAMNIATRTSKAEVLLYLTPEVEVQPDTIDRLAEALESDPEIAAVCPLLEPSRVFALPGKEALARVCQGQDLPAVSIDKSKEFVDVEYPTLDCLMIRKGFVKGMNYFDEKRFGHYWADADLAGQVKRAGKKIRVYPSIKATYHPSPDPLQGDSLAEADKINGAIALLGKYGEGSTSLKVSAALGALGSFNIGKVSKILGGQKLDGNQ